MEFPKQIKDTVYRLLQEPTLDHFREFYRIKLANTMPSILNKSGLRKISWPN